MAKFWQLNIMPLLKKLLQKKDHKQHSEMAQYNEISLSQAPEIKVNNHALTHHLLSNDPLAPLVSNSASPEFIERYINERIQIAGQKYLSLGITQKEMQNCLRQFTHYIEHASFKTLNDYIKVHANLFNDYLASKNNPKYALYIPSTSDQSDTFGSNNWMASFAVNYFSYPPADILRDDSKISESFDSIVYIDDAIYSGHQFLLGASTKLENFQKDGMQVHIMIPFQGAGGFRDSGDYVAPTSHSDFSVAHYTNDFMIYPFHRMITPFEALQKIDQDFAFKKGSKLLRPSQLVSHLFFANSINPEEMISTSLFYADHKVADGRSVSATLTNKRGNTDKEETKKKGKEHYSLFPTTLPPYKPYYYEGFKSLSEDKEWTKTLKNPPPSVESKESKRPKQKK